MKKVLIALALCMVMVLAVAGPVFARTQGAHLWPVAADPGGGSVLFVNSGGGSSLVLVVSLKGLTANTLYTIDLEVDPAGVPPPISVTLGTITTNSKGHASFHDNRVFVGGTYDLRVVVKRSGTAKFMSSWVEMTFK